MIKRNLFVVETEYHVLNTLSIILDKFIDHSEFENIVIVIKSDRRLKENLDLGLFPFIDKIVIIDSDIFSGLFSTKLRKMLKQVFAKPVDRLFYFNENRIISTYLINKLSKRKTTICLCQDGLKAYVSKRSTPLHSRLKSTLLMHLELWRNFIPVNRFYLYDSGFGKYKHDDEYWLTHPELFNSNKFNKPVERINTDLLAKNHILIERIFGFPEKIDFLENCDYFYVNQPFTDIATDFEYENVLVPLLKNGKIVIKTHPHTSIYALKKYANTAGITVMKSEIPAEIYIQHLQHKSIISGWSTALLINNPSCSFYWIFPYLKKNIKILNINIPIVPMHVKVVDDISTILNQSSHYD